MDENKNQNIYKKIISYITFTLIISQILTSWTGFTIVDPFLSKFGERKMSIEPINYPLNKEGKQFIRVNVLNEGLRTIKNVNVEYKFECLSENTKKAELSKKTLKKEESDFFEFEAELNTNCSLITQPQLIEFYSDRNGVCYVKAEEISSPICSYCKLKVNVYDGFEIIGNLTYWYPFVENNITLSSKLTGDNNCLPYEEAPNKMELTFLPDRTIKISIGDFSVGCIRGDIEKEWCINQYPKIYD